MEPTRACNRCKRAFPLAEFDNVRADYKSCSGCRERRKTRQRACSVANLPPAKRPRKRQVLGDLVLGRVIHLSRRYSSKPDSPQYEDYCRVKLIFHHPFSEPTELRIPDHTGELSYIAAYRACCRDCERHPRDRLNRFDDEDEDEDGEEVFSDSEFESEREGTPEPLKGLGYSGRNNPHNASDLGARTLDSGYDWDSNSNHERFGDQRHFFENARLRAGVIIGTQNDPNTLTEAQRKAFDTVIKHYTDMSNGRTQLLMHVDGSAGTGKSYLIDMISTHLGAIVERYIAPDPVVQVAPTGVAAFGIRGQTLHRTFRFPVRTKFEGLSNSVLLNLQQSLRSLGYLIIDEKSMLGLKQLYWLDARLRQLNPSKNDLPFAGVNIILLGSFYQLPPVAMAPIYSTSAKHSRKPEMVRAQKLYQLFDQTVRLTQIMRQQGEDAESVQFRTLLQELRHGRITPADFEFLQRRVKENSSRGSNRPSTYMLPGKC